MKRCAPKWEKPAAPDLSLDRFYPVLPPGKHKGADYDQDDATAKHQHRSSRWRSQAEHGQVYEGRGDLDRDQAIRNVKQPQQPSTGDFPPRHCSYP